MVSYNIQYPISYVKQIWSVDTTRQSCVELLSSVKFWLLTMEDPVEKRRRRNRECQAKHRAKETAEQKAARRIANAEYSARRRKAETLEERERRQAADKKYRERRKKLRDPIQRAEYQAKCMQSKSPIQRAGYESKLKQPIKAVQRKTARRKTEAVYVDLGGKNVAGLECHSINKEPEVFHNEEVIIQKADSLELEVVKFKIKQEMELEICD